MRRRTRGRGAFLPSGAGETDGQSLFGPNHILTRRQFVACTSAIVTVRLYPAQASGTTAIDSQPYFANLNRALNALADLGAPMAPEHARRISDLARQANLEAVEVAESILDAYTLARLSLHPDGSLSVDVGGARRVLVEQGWRMFLVRIGNPSGRTDPVAIAGGNGAPARMARDLSDFHGSQRADLGDTLNKAPLIEKMWLLSEMYGSILMPIGTRAIPVVTLCGIPIEYHVIQLFSRDSGLRTAALEFQITKLWSMVSKNIDFNCLPTREVTLAVRDADGLGCMAALTIKDSQGRVYPPQTMRIAPDMFFQEHVYRADGETVRLPDGEYRVRSRRGPEYVEHMQTVTIEGGRDRIEVTLERWIDPSRWGWYSGDTHIHAAGCKHYQSPTEGVTPETMIRHVRGEGLSLGEVLTWGGGWYYQKQFFTGRAESPAATLEYPPLQAANNARWLPYPTPKDKESLLRYDVEISGFPSSMCGHLVLLQLREQDYPGTKAVEDWPSWNLPVLRWAKAQGAMVGYSHCGWGMSVESTDLPNYEIPSFDSVGTNEAIVDVVHGHADFLAGCDTYPLAELNAWYHMLNCGYRLALVGETDYPCIYGERPGVGRTYVQLERRPTDDAGYRDWIEGLRQGRLYCGDGRSHILDFQVQGRHIGEDFTSGAADELPVEAVVAARLDTEPPPDTGVLGKGALRRWHLENSRIGKSRDVAVELIVNGIAVDRVVITADGTPRKIAFKTPLVRSAWVALRILYSVHTYPIFVHVDRRSIRASKRSAQWCRSCVDKLWQVKSPFMRESERTVAAEAFDCARKAYEAIANECEVP